MKTKPKSRAKSLAEKRADSKAKALDKARSKGAGKPIAKPKKVSKVHPKSGRDSLGAVEIKPDGSDGKTSKLTRKVRHVTKL